MWITGSAGGELQHDPAVLASQTMGSHHPLHAILVLVEVVMDDRVSSRVAVALLGGGSLCGEEVGARAVALVASLPGGAVVVPDEDAEDEPSEATAGGEPAGQSSSSILA